MLKKIIVCGLPLFAVGQVNAADEAATQKGLWQGNVELGVISTTGNTKNLTINTKAGLGTERKNWRHKLEATWLRAEDDGNKTAEKYTAKGQTDFKITEHNYVLAAIEYENELNSGYDYRLTETLGYGYRALDLSNMSLDFEIGPGARQSQETNGGKENVYLMRAAVKYAWAISDTSEFGEIVKVDYNPDMTISTSTTQLSAKINSSLATKLAFMIKNTSNSPTGVATDTETTVTLVYGF